MSQENYKSKNQYSTSDLSLATAISLWFPIESIDRTNPRKAVFVFVGSRKLDQLLEAYWKRKVSIEPQAYFNQLKAVKTRLYAER